MKLLKKVPLPGFRTKILLLKHGFCLAKKIVLKDDCLYVHTVAMNELLCLKNAGA